MKDVKISKGTIIRTIMAILVIVNIVLERMGYDIINVDESQIGMIIELLIEIAIVIVGFWKNNSFSEKAIKADEYLKYLRDSDDSIKLDGIETESEEDDCGDK